MAFEEGLFYRQPGDAPPNFFPDYIPTETPANPSLSPARVNEICGGDQFCVFDFLATGEETIANITVNAVNTFAADEMEIDMNEGKV